MSAAAARSMKTVQLARADAAQVCASSPTSRPSLSRARSNVLVHGKPQLNRMKKGGVSPELWAKHPYVSPLAAKTAARDKQKL